MNSPYISFDDNNKNFKKDNNEISIESLLFSNYIRYDKLKELTLKQFQGSDSDTLNVYIDMYSMIRPLYTRSLLNIDTIFTSSVLNLAAHIRAYYKTRHSVNTNIYIIFSTNTNDLGVSGVVKEWRNDIDILPNPKRDEIINMNVSILKLLCQYIPNVYFIYGTVEPAIMIYNHIINHRNGNPNIIITKDKLSWQIPSQDFSTCVFRPRKTKAEDTSYCVNYHNVFKQWRHTVNHVDYDPAFIIRPEMLSLYIAYTNFPEKNLRRLYSPIETLERLEFHIKRGYILPGYNFPEAIRGFLSSEEKPSRVYKDIYNNKFNTNLANRYEYIDIRRAVSLYMNLPESRDQSYMIDKIDVESIKEINNKYFIQNPIDIIRLFA